MTKGLIWCEPSHNFPQQPRHQHSTLLLPDVTDSWRSKCLVGHQPFFPVSVKHCFLSLSLSVRHVFCCCYCCCCDDDDDDFPRTLVYVRSRSRSRSGAAYRQTRRRSRSIHLPVQQHRQRHQQQQQQQQRHRLSNRPLFPDDGDVEGDREAAAGAAAASTTAVKQVMFVPTPEQVREALSADPDLIQVRIQPAILCIGLSRAAERVESSEGSGKSTVVESTSSFLDYVYLQASFFSHFACE